MDYPDKSDIWVFGIESERGRMHMKKLQNYEIKDESIRQAFVQLKRDHPEKLESRLNLSWSNWGFGLETLEASCRRLQRAGIRYIELHGNHYGPDLGYSPAETRNILAGCGMKTSGVCGMFSPDNDLSSNRPVQRQAAIDYLKREISFTAEMGGKYLLVVPGAVGRAAAYDSSEFERSTDSLRRVAGLFAESGVRAAIEPIRAAEVSFIHTISEAKNYIAAVGHPGIRHINGDAYHMLVSESHIGQAILDAGEMLTNLHMADTNRCALGAGFLDLDTIIMALYLIGYNNESCFVTPEPLGPGGDPYPAMNSRPDPAKLDRLVQETADYFRERETAVLDYQLPVFR
jgi:D-psicose/D-tagatose/L-ribulose 3-epimerase